MNPSSYSVSSILVLLGLSLVLVAFVCEAAPANQQQQQSGFAAESSEDSDSSMPMDESAAVDPEFHTLTGGDDSPRNGNDDEDASASMSSSSNADSADEPRGSDSNIADAKIQLSPTDMTAAAGHHYHGHHSPSGKMEMGAHTEKKGAFGWHAKFPVGGKGRR